MNNIIYNLKIMMQKKTFRFSFILIMLLCVYLPFYYAWKYRDFSTIQLPAAHTLYVGNALGLGWQYIHLVFPFLVIFPYSMAFFDEAKEGTILYIQVRNGRKQYYVSQLITCFIGGFIILCIPFMVNILLNEIIFPANANDYISTYDQYTDNWSECITGSNIMFPVISKGYILKSMYINHPQLHNILFAVLSGLTSGVMSMLAYAFSIFIRKSRLFIFLMMYVFFQVFTMIDSVLFERWNEANTYVCTRITSYISNGFLQNGKVYWLFWGLIILVLIFAIKVVKGRIEEDEI